MIHKRTRILGLIAILVLCFAAIFYPHNPIDQWASQSIRSESMFHPFGMIYIQVAVALAQLGSLAVTLGILTALMLVQFGRKQWSALALTAWSSAMTVLIVWALKYTIMRPRPLIAYDSIQTFGSSFPSAHSAYAMLLALVLSAHWCRAKCDQRKTTFLNALLVIWVIAMGWSRIYLGAHYLSDVLGGYLIAWLVVRVSLPVVNQTYNESKSN